ncbi:MAG: DoxX family protein [Anaerolineae bacterium]|nr:DoxX family protein [Anaerolineae bacterium]
MKYALWIVQVLLALAFLATGFMKLTMPIDQLAQNMVWPGDIPAWLVRFIGLAELAGGLGMVLPALTRIQPQLTPLAGASLALVMFLAAGFHLTRGEFGFIVPNIVLLALAAFVAYGRWKVAPIAPRSASPKVGLPAKS